MARFMVTAMPFSGHVAPMAAVAAALVERGHDVRFYTGAAFRGRVERTGARFVPWRNAPDFDEQNLRRPSRACAARRLRAVDDQHGGSFVATAPPSSPTFARSGTASGGTCSSATRHPAPSVIAEALGCRWATVAILPLHLVSPHGRRRARQAPAGADSGGQDARCLIPALSGRLNRAADRARDAVGLPAAGAGFDRQVWSAELILASGVAALDFDIPRPPHLHWVGRLWSPRRSRRLRGGASSTGIPSSSSHRARRTSTRRTCSRTDGPRRPGCRRRCLHRRPRRRHGSVRDPPNARTAAMLPFDELSRGRRCS
jgi:hypothetical protein